MFSAWTLSLSPPFPLTSHNFIILLCIFLGEEAHHRPVWGPEGWTQLDLPAWGSLWSYLGMIFVSLNQSLSLSPSPSLHPSLPLSPSPSPSHIQILSPFLPNGHCVYSLYKALLSCKHFTKSFPHYLAQILFFLYYFFISVFITKRVKKITD